MGELWCGKSIISGAGEEDMLGRKKRGNGVSFSKPRTPLYHRIHKFKSSVVKSIVDLGVNSRFIHSDPDLIRTHFMASTTPPQIAVAVVRHLSSSNLALL